MTDHVRDGTLESRVLLEDDDTLIEHFLRGGEGGTLVVTFDPILYLWTRPPFGHEFLRKQQLDVVAVRKKREHFYQPLSREAFMAAVAPVTARYARVVSYGSSLGRGFQVRQAHDLVRRMHIPIRHRHHPAVPGRDHLRPA